jgi:hypothetical protein
MRSRNNTAAKRTKRNALRRYWREVSETYRQARNAKELGSHRGASDVRLIDPRTGQLIRTMPKRKPRSEIERGQAKRIGRMPSRNGSRPT